jgi:hypothetical protein
MSTTLIDELEQAATRAAVRAQETDERTAGVRWQHLRGIHEAEASRLRQRAAWVRELERIAKESDGRGGWVAPPSRFIEQLTGPGIPAAAPSPETGTAAGPTDGQWVIVAAHISTNGVAYFWGPNFSGYTASLARAGRYTEQEAKKREVWSERMEVAVPLAEAEEAQFPAVTDDNAHAWFRRRFPGPKPAAGPAPGPVKPRDEAERVARMECQAFVGLPCTCSFHDATAEPAKPPATHWWGVSCTDGGNHDFTNHGRPFVQDDCKRCGAHWDGRTWRARTPAAGTAPKPEEGRFRCICPEKRLCPKCIWSCLYCRHERGTRP